MTDPVPSAPGSDDAAAVRPSARWTAARQVGVGAIVSTVILALLALVPVVPWLVDDASLDRIVRAVALDVRDFGEARGQERLAAELASEGLEGRVGDGCTIATDGNEVEVVCAWEVVVSVPVIDRRLPVPFRSEAHITQSGDLQ